MHNTFSSFFLFSLLIYSSDSSYAFYTITRKIKHCTHQILKKKARVTFFFITFWSFFLFSVLFWLFVLHSMFFDIILCLCWCFLFVLPSSFVFLCFSFSFWYSKSSKIVSVSVFVCVWVIFFLFLHFSTFHFVNSSTLDQLNICAFLRLVHFSFYVVRSFVVIAIAICYEHRPVLRVFSLV